MDVPNGSANIQELLVLLDSLLKLAEIVIQNSCTVISSSLVSRFAGSLASKSQDFIILESLLSRDAVIRVGIRHGEP